MNPIFYCKDGRVGVEIDGLKHDAPDALYDELDQERRRLIELNKEYLQQKIAEERKLSMLTGEM